MSYHKYQVKISDRQKERLQNAIQSKKAVSLRLAKDNLSGDDMIH